MKFIELKKELENKVCPAYLISGNDRFLCYSALDLIKKAANISLSDLNEVVIAGENCTLDDIVKSASVFPFVDAYRLVQVNNFSAKVKEKNNVLSEYLKNPLESTILVFFNLEANDAIKPFMDKIVHIDCDKLDVNTIARVVKTKAKQSGTEIEDQAIEKLILYCNNDMARITSELEKLICYASDKQIREQDVMDLVEQDKEYQVFELSEFIAKGNKEKALDLVYTICSDSRGTFSLLTPLYNSYKRALYVAVNKDKTDSELASLLGIKEYAVKMSKNQAKSYNPKKLKQIVDMLYEADRNIKMGKINDQIAIKTVVLNILKIRG